MVALSVIKEKTAELKKAQDELNRLLTDCSPKQIQFIQKIASDSTLNANLTVEKIDGALVIKGLKCNVAKDDLATENDCGKVWSVAQEIANKIAKDAEKFPHNHGDKNFVLVNFGQDRSSEYGVEWRNRNCFKGETLPGTYDFAKNFPSIQMEVPVVNLGDDNFPVSVSSRGRRVFVLLRRVGGRDLSDYGWDSGWYDGFWFLFSE